MDTHAHARPSRLRVRLLLRVRVDDAWNAANGEPQRARRLTRRGLQLDLSRPTTLQRKFKRLAIISPDEGCSIIAR